jgi:hypothetical protein
LDPSPIQAAKFLYGSGAFSTINVVESRIVNPGLAPQRLRDEQI